MGFAFAVCMGGVNLWIYAFASRFVADDPRTDIKKS